MELTFIDLVINIFKGLCLVYALGLLFYFSSYPIAGIVWVLTRPINLFKPSK